MALQPFEQSQVALSFVVQGNRRPGGFEKRTSAAEAVKLRPFSARLKSCPDTKPQSGDYLGGMLELYPAEFSTDEITDKHGS